FLVTGYDNKGALKRYKMDFGNGVSLESDTGSFQQVFDTAGTYTIKGYVEDTQGNWKGGSGTCEKTFYVTTKPLASQPSTGTPTALSILALASGVVGISLLASNGLRTPLSLTGTTKKRRRH